MFEPVACDSSVASSAGHGPGRGIGRARGRRDQRQHPEVEARRRTHQRFHGVAGRARRQRHIGGVNVVGGRQDLGVFLRTALGQRVPGRIVVGGGAVGLRCGLAVLRGGGVDGRRQSQQLGLVKSQQHQGLQFRRYWTWAKSRIFAVKTWLMTGLLTGRKAI